MTRLAGTLIDKAASVITTIERFIGKTLPAGILDKAVQSARLGERETRALAVQCSCRTWEVHPYHWSKQKPNDYFQHEFQGSAVHVVGFGVWWQGLSSLRIRQWLDIPETTPHIAYQNSRAFGNAVVLPANKTFHVQVAAVKKGNFSAPLPSSVKQNQWEHSKEGGGWGSLSESSCFTART
jgi:hypothetical protein